MQCHGGSAALKDRKNSENFGPYLLIIYLNDLTGIDKRPD